MTDKLIKQATRYLRQVLKIQARFQAWEGAVSLPFYLQQNYNIYQVTLLRQAYLVATIKTDEDLTPAAIKKQLTRVEESSAQRVILLCSKVSSYNRKRLIDHGVQFIVPENQLFLPELGLDLREYYRAAPKKSSFLCPSAQAIILMILYSRNYQSLTTKELARKTGFSMMTLNRVFDELLRFELAKESTTSARERSLSMVLRGRELWEAARKYMLNPVRHKKKATFKQGLAAYKTAGLSALSRMSMLAGPRTPVVAMTSAEYHLALSRHDLREVQNPYPNEVEVEVWKYNPDIVTSEEIVDPFSLYLSMQDDEDTRTIGELDKMMEKIQW